MPKTNKSKTPVSSMKSAKVKESFTRRDYYFALVAALLMVGTFFYGSWWRENIGSNPDEMSITAFPVWPFKVKRTMPKPTAMPNVTAMPKPSATPVVTPMMRKY